MKISKKMLLTFFTLIILLQVSSTTTINAYTSTKNELLVERAQPQAPTNKAFEYTDVTDFANAMEAKTHSSKAIPFIMPYRLWTPTDYDESKKYPVIIVLHGASRRGDDNIAQFKNLTMFYLRCLSAENQKTYPTFIVAPQTAEGSSWSFDKGNVKKGSLAAVVEIVEALKKEKNIDDQRIYVLGNSMGGTGSWSANAIIKAGGEKIKYTEYPNGFHNIQNDVFLEPELLSWLFSQKGNDDK